MNPGQETLDWIHAQYPATVGNLKLVELRQELLNG